MSNPRISDLERDLATARAESAALREQIFDEIEGMLVEFEGACYAEDAAVVRTIIGDLRERRALATSASPPAPKAEPAPLQTWTGTVKPDPKVLAEMLSRMSPEEIQRMTVAQPLPIARPMIIRADPTRVPIALTDLDADEKRLLYSKLWELYDGAAPEQGAREPPPGPVDYTGADHRRCERWNGNGRRCIRLAHPIGETCDFGQRASEPGKGDDNA